MRKFIEQDIEFIDKIIGITEKLNEGEKGFSTFTVYINSLDEFRKTVSFYEERDWESNKSEYVEGSWNRTWIQVIRTYPSIRHLSIYLFKTLQSTYATLKNFERALSDEKI